MPPFIGVMLRNREQNFLSAFLLPAFRPVAWFWISKFAAIFSLTQTKVAQLSGYIKYLLPCMRGCSFKVEMNGNVSELCKEYADKNFCLRYFWLAFRLAAWFVAFEICLHFFQLRRSWYSLRGRYIKYLLLYTRGIRAMWILRLFRVRLRLGRFDRLKATCGQGWKKIFFWINEPLSWTSSNGRGCPHITIRRCSRRGGLFCH